MWFFILVEEIWGYLVDGGFIVLVCFGDYFFLSELFNVEVIGSILVIVIVFIYCFMFFEIVRFIRIFN